MTRALILCAGNASRWNGYLGVRKQLVPVDGEPLLHRTVRLLRERGIEDIRVVVKPGDEQRFAADGATVEVAKLNPSRFEADRFYSSRHLWSDTGRTLILYGDVWFSDAAMDTIAKDVRPGWQVYGRPRGSKLTGCRHGELFALSWWPEQHAEVDAKLAEIVCLQSARIINRSLGWELFRALCGRTGADVRRSRGTPFGRMTIVDDWTDDFDKPADYDGWLRRRGRSVSVLVPWRGGDPDREAAWEWVRAKWQATYPDWEILVGECPPGPWRKAAALADAAKRATTDVVIMADADVWCDSVAEAVDAVFDGGVRWAIPHYHVHRLTKEATAAVLTGGELHGETIRRPYPGYAGGGMVVLQRRTLCKVPMDPRFEGWGQDDQAWSTALRCLAGPAYRGTAPLWHLWHEPAPRMTSAVGSPESLALWKRYRRAAHSQRAMRDLIAEFAS